MRGLRALHLCISYVPVLPSLIGLTHLELHAVVFNGVQACALVLICIPVCVAPGFKDSVQPRPDMRAADLTPSCCLLHRLGRCAHGHGC